MHSMRRSASAFFAALTLCAPATSLVSTVSNILPRRATTGQILDAHDGNVVEDPHTAGLFYYFAAGYGNCTCVFFATPAAPAQ